MYRRQVCERAVYGGGPNDPRTLVYRYQQRLRADLLAKAATEADRPPWRLTCRPAIKDAVGSFLVLFRGGSPDARRPATVIPYSRVVERRQRRDTLGLVGLQQRILDAVAHHRVLSGTLGELAAQLNTGATSLRAALRELGTLGWVAVQIQPDGQLALCLERRHYAGTIPATGERRQSSSAGWML
jgi:hypothetical protein